MMGNLIKTGLCHSQFTLRSLEFVAGFLGLKSTKES